MRSPPLGGGADLRLPTFFSHETRAVDECFRLGGRGLGQVTVARHIGRATTAADPSQEPRTIKSTYSVTACVMSYRLAKVLQLPEPAEVGVRFCKPGERQYHSAKHDAEDSDITTVILPAVDRRSIDRLTLTAAHSNNGTQRGSATRITGTP